MWFIQTLNYLKNNNFIILNPSLITVEGFYFKRQLYITMTNNFLVLDCETGGLKPLENPICEVAAIVLEPTKLKEIAAYETYVQPYDEGWKIEKKAIEATQTDLRKVKAGKLYKQVCKELIVFFKAANPTGRKESKPILVGHNIAFDIDFLIVLFSLCGKELWDYIHPISQDTMLEMKDIEEGALSKDESTRYTLTACAERLGIKLVNAHGAMADVKATAEIKRYLTKLKRAAYLSLKGGNGNINLHDNNSGKDGNRTRERDRFHFELQPPKI